MPQLEIEKRYLIKSTNIEKILNNDFIEFKKERLEQFYLEASIEKTLRYRKEGNKFIKNSKKGSGLVREELEEEVDESEYKLAKKSKKGGVIKKTRYSFTINSNHFEIDVFKGKLKGLHVLEVEFSNIEEANSFKMPQVLESLIIKEITNEAIYSNGAISHSMQIPLRADAKISYRQIMDSKVKELPKFDIYISKYENAKNALEYTLNRLLTSVDYQLNEFINTEEFTHVKLAYKGLNRYRIVLNMFKKYIKAKQFNKQLFNVNSLIILLQNSIEAQKSFKKLLKCKKEFPLEQQNRVLKTLLNLAHERKVQKEKLLSSDLIQKFQKILVYDLRFKKNLQKPFDYIAYRVKKSITKEIKRALKKSENIKILFDRLKEYKIALKFFKDEFVPIKHYKEFKVGIELKESIKIIEKYNKKLAKELSLYCKRKKSYKIARLISKTL